ncbi:MAG: Shufflon-specific DNA recombinase [uncultured Caballeronia sp.]|nr:MAG: Shufflon-specific DNA recombinase [uncultured Caballeronia sp.]
MSLQWENVDLKRGVAHLPATKNGDARDVPLSPRAVAVLQALKNNCDDAKDTSKVAPSRDGLGDHGTSVFKIRSDAVTRAFERAVARARKLYQEECSEAGRRPDVKFLTNLRFHDLRHEATSRLVSIFPMHELTKIIGHKDPRMLMRYYHPSAGRFGKTPPVEIDIDRPPESRSAPTPHATGERKEYAARDDCPLSAASPRLSLSAPSKRLARNARCGLPKPARRAVCAWLLLARPRLPHRSTTEVALRTLATENCRQSRPGCSQGGRSWLAGVLPSSGNASWPISKG